MTNKIEVEADYEQIPYQDALEFFGNATDSGNNIALLLDSRRRDLTHGTKSVVMTKPAIHFKGKGDHFQIMALNEAGKGIISALEDYAPRGERLASQGGVGAIQFHNDRIDGKVSRRRNDISEDSRIREPSLATALRSVMQMFNTSDSDLGFYGAVAYDFVRQFENIGKRFAGGSGDDISLFLPGEVVVFDIMRETATRKQYFFDRNKTEVTAVKAPVMLSTSGIKSLHDLSDEQVLASVEEIVSQIKNGEMIQAVLSRTEYAPMKKHPLQSYAELCKKNPSPYCFYLNLGNSEVLFGASPELHVRVNKGTAEIRPLAGTRRRAGNAVDDYHIKIGLLGDEKERREHVMLVDLARNDLSRICDYVSVERYMDVVEFPNLFHIGSVITGKMRGNYDGIDAIAATLPAGTLSGAPKVRAMQAIEQVEGSRRNYYGGCIGAFYLDGSCNTAITIRSVYCKDGIVYLRAGAGIVALSEPQRELEEILLKTENQRKVI